MSAVDLLSRVSLFVDLSEAQVAELASNLTRRVFAPDTLIFAKGSRAHSFYLIESGAVRSFVVSLTGQEIMLDVFRPGDCFGEIGLLEGNVQPFSAAALERTVAWALYSESFFYYLDHYPTLARRMMRLLAERLEQATESAEDRAFLDVAGRVAAVLLRLAGHPDRPMAAIQVDLHLTQSEFASWCGASREMVNKVLRTFREQGLIATDGHGILILDRSALKSRCLR